MIGLLRGTLLEKHPPFLLVEAGGVGYEVEAPLSTFFVLPEVGATVTLYTHLVVREDAHALYGFASRAERKLFRSLIRVNGVGPKLAVTLLSGISADEFARCVREGDAETLMRLPGIGRKTAERLVVEMRDRLDTVTEARGAQVASERPVTPADEALSALVALGYKPQEAARLLKGVPSEGLTSEDILRRALQNAVR